MEGTTINVLSLSRSVLRERINLLDFPSIVHRCQGWVRNHHSGPIASCLLLFKSNILKSYKATRKTGRFLDFVHGTPFVESFFNLVSFESVVLEEVREELTRKEGDRWIDPIQLPTGDFFTEV